MRILLTSPAGSPDHPRTWSGTPYQLMQAFTADGRLQPVAWSSQLEGTAATAARRFDRMMGLQHAFLRGPAQHWLGSTRAAAAERSHACDAILHLGSYDLGWTRRPRPDYLYIDNTYDIWESQALGARQLSKGQRRWFRRMERWALAQARHVFTVGEHVRDNLVQDMGLPADRITVVSAGLGGIKPYDGPKDHAAARLLIVAKIRPGDKGLPMLVEAMDQLRRQLPQASLTVVGGQGYPEIAGKEGITGTGWISLDDLQKLYEEASLLVMPATYEPWGLSYIEALVCRAPVVGLARNAFPEISDNGRFGFMLRDESAEGLARLLLDALSDPARLERMGAQGQRHCLERYSWAGVARKIADVIVPQLAPKA